MARKKQAVDDSYRKAGVHLDNQIAAIKGVKDSLPKPTSGPRSSRPAQVSVADEILKLVDLRDQGILTDAEFNQQKAKLLES